MIMTPNRLRLMYEALAALPPCSGWKLPNTDRIKFKLSRTDRYMGLYDNGCGTHEITLSTVHCKTLMDYISTLAHEMVHLACEKSGACDHSYHDSEFNARAADICNAWGLNFKEF